jgi:hypothetical protein
MLKFGEVHQWILSFGHCEVHVSTSGFCYNCRLHGFVGAYGHNSSSNFGSERHCLAVVLCPHRLFHPWQHQALTEVS